jgi:hypothetical protein
MTRLLPLALWACGSSGPVSITSVSIEPMHPITTTTLTCAATAADMPAERVRHMVAYRWRVDDRELPVTQDKLSGIWLQKGQQIICEVLAGDGIAERRPVQSLPVTIGNVAPTIDSVHLIPHYPGDGNSAPDSVSVDVYGWFDLDGDPQSLSYAWTVNGTLVPDAVAAHFDLSELAADDVLEVRVTPSDGDDSGTPLTHALILTQPEP